MAPSRELPPYGWRYGSGYLHHEQAPPQPPPCGPPGFFYPGQEAGPWGPQPFPWVSSFIAPPPAAIIGLHHPFMWSGPQQQGTPPPDNDDDDDDDETPPEYKLEGGLVSAAVYHYQPGKSVCFHALGKPNTPLEKILKGDHDGYVDVHIHQFNENSTVEHVMKKLGAGKGGMMTQVHEQGKGEFFQGTTFEQGDDKAKMKLSELGWSGAGLDDGVGPVYILIRKKDGGK
jgi:hypothetical protein